MNFDFRKYVTAVILAALIWIMALTPMGYVPFFGVDITLLCIPVIVGTCALGLQYGLFLGFMFALTSLFIALMGGSAGGLLLPLLNAPLSLYPTIFIPRLLIPVFAWLVYKSTSKWNTILSHGLSAMVGSLVNTVFFLGMVYVLSKGLLTESFHMSNYELLVALGKVAVMNGMLEAVAAVLVCTPVILVLRKIFGNAS